MSEQHVDVLIVGAGLSGIGAAVHLQRECPSKSYLIVESRDAIGGTWDLFRYPGIRSDSDMHTLGYNFKPWVAEKSIADGPAIRQYVTETANEYDIERHIRFNQCVRSADWNSAKAIWNVTTENPNTGEQSTYTCNFLNMCAGYYSYTDPYTPQFDGRDDFQGDIVHPQLWEEGYDYAGKKVVIIGSGATAITLLPAMTDKAEHVTMLQRSPSYVISRPARDKFANSLRKILPSSVAYNITRWKNRSYQQFIYGLTRTKPDVIKSKLLAKASKKMSPEIVDEHFTPRYNPWDQRMCLIPDDDLFDAINSGKARVVTDHIDRFVEEGVRLESGKVLEADLIITATGLNLLQLGGVDFSVDEKTINFADTWTYKGMMYSNIPNLMSTFGYINASWTLRADLNCEFLCRILNHMDKTGARQVTPRLRDEDQNMPQRDWIQDFSSGYMQRSMHEYPKQGDREPWVNPQNFKKDRKMIRFGALEDGVLTFTNAEAGIAGFSTNLSQPIAAE